MIDDELLIVSHCVHILTSIVFVADLQTTCNPEMLGTKSSPEERDVRSVQETIELPKLAKPRVRPFDEDFVPSISGLHVVWKSATKTILVRI